MKLSICSFFSNQNEEMIFVSFRSKQFDERSFLAPNALLEKAMIYIDLGQKQKANEYLQKSM